LAFMLLFLLVRASTFFIFYLFYGHNMLILVVQCWKSYIDCGRDLIVSL